MGMTVTSAPLPHLRKRIRSPLLWPVCTPARSRTPDRQTDRRWPRLGSPEHSRARDGIPQFQCEPSRLTVPPERDDSMCALLESFRHPPIASTPPIAATETGCAEPGRPNTASSSSLADRVLRLLHR